MLLATGHNDSDAGLLLAQAEPIAFVTGIGESPRADERHCLFPFVFSTMRPLVSTLGNDQL